jgi:hypothetical protein
MAIEDEQTEDLNNESSDLLGREGFTARTLTTSTAHKRRARPFQSDANLFEQHLGTTVNATSVRKP